MEIKTHFENGAKVAEVIATELIIITAADGLDLLGNLYYQGFDKIILHEKNITPSFFDLKNGLAGEILQKFSNYRVRLAIVGDFAHYSGRSIRDFIYESNKTGHVNFVGSVSEAVSRLSKD
jgi:hypothetical protein